MIDVSRTPEFSHCGNMNSISMCTSADQELGSIGGRSRQRSHSYYSPDDCKNYGVQLQAEETCLRPRSRYVILLILQGFLLMHMDFCFNVVLKLDSKHTSRNTKRDWKEANLLLTHNQYEIYCSPGPFTVMRHQSFTPSMTWENLQGPVHWGWALLSSIKWTKRKREKVKELVFVSPPRSLNQKSCCHQENLMVLKSCSIIENLKKKKLFILLMKMTDVRMHILLRQ